MRPDELERRLQERLDALPPAARAELLHVLMLPDLEADERIGEFWSCPRSRTFARSSETEPRLCGLVLNPIPDSEPRGRWPVWRGPRRIGRERHRDDGNRIADRQAEESGEVGAVPFVTLERVELCDASSLRSVPIVMLDDLAG
jgi:hypothetical protein